MRCVPLASALLLLACSSKGPPGVPLPTSHWDDPAWRRDAGTIAFDRGPAIDLPASADAPAGDTPAGDAPAGDALSDTPRVDAPGDVPLTCGAGQGACGGACFDLQQSTLHCGACGNACALQGARSRCASGRCAVDLCFQGAADCDGNAANGCETLTESDPANCGACGNACPGSQVCANGACATSCPGGTVACGRACVVTSMSVAHCGACNRRCAPAPGGVVSCRAGVCAVTCAGQRGDCDGLADNGCEVDTGSDPTHCGRCGQSCPVGGNTDPLCVNSECRFRCRVGFDDCDGNPANGCEADLASELHCGRCGRACGAGGLCAAGECVGACGPGITRCGSTCADLASSPTNCGACGNVCRLGERCLEGACASTGAPRSCGPGDMADCALVEVPGGTFRMGGTLENVRVRRFALDANEVTVGRFRRFWANRPAALASVRASPVVFPGGQSIPWRLNAAPPGTGAGCNWSMSPTTTDRERHPMNCVDWTLAMEFCVWDGGRLPTEAEWEFVAQGWVTAGLQAGRPLPWGTHDPTQEDITAMMMPDPDGGLLCPYAQWVPCPGADGRRTRRVGLGVLGAPAGVFDLGGNVAEWTASDVADLEAMCWTERRENPLCTNTGTQLRNHRGGAYDAVMMSELRNTMRGGLFADQSAPTVGFRCARTR